MVASVGSGPAASKPQSSNWGHQRDKETKGNTQARNQLPSRKSRRRHCAKHDGSTRQAAYVHYKYHSAFCHCKNGATLPGPANPLAPLFWNHAPALHFLYFVHHLHLQLVLDPFRLFSSTFRSLVSLRTLLSGGQDLEKEGNNERTWTRKTTPKNKARAIRKRKVPLSGAGSLRSPHFILLSLCLTATF